MDRKPRLLAVVIAMLFSVAQAVRMTDVGTPPAETLVVDMLNGRASNVTSGYNTGGCTRWANDHVTKRIDARVALPSADPRVIEIITKIMKEIVREQPFAALIGTTKMVPVTTQYREGFQTAENHFEGPWWWWSNCRLTPARLKATGK